MDEIYGSLSKGQERAAKLDDFFQRPRIVENVMWHVDKRGEFIKTDGSPNRRGDSKNLLAEFCVLGMANLLQHPRV